MFCFILKHIFLHISRLVIKLLCAFHDLYYLTLPIYARFEMLCDTLVVVSGLCNLF